jgi:hypothetical protein
MTPAQNINEISPRASPPLSSISIEPSSVSAAQTCDSARASTPQFFKLTSGDFHTPHLHPNPNQNPNPMNLDASFAVPVSDAHNQNSSNNNTSTMQEHLEDPHKLDDYNLDFNELWSLVSVQTDDHDIDIPMAAMATDGGSSMYDFTEQDLHLTPNEPNTVLLPSGPYIHPPK